MIKKEKKKRPLQRTLAKESLAQVFSCEFREISKNTFFLQNASGNCFCFFTCKNISRQPILNLQSVTKIMGKTAFWTTSCFYPIPPLNDVEKQ